MTHLETVATHAARMSRKPNKTQAFDILKSAIEGERALSDKEAASLYNFFMPAINKKKVKNDTEWLALAAEKQSSYREYLTFLHSDGETTYCTNGYRLHFIHDKREAGYYDQQGEKVDVDLNYPDVKRVIPNKKEMTKHTVKISELAVKYSDANIKAINLYDDMWFSVEMVLQALQGVDDVEFFASEGLNLVLFENIADTGRTAVIMPLAK